MIAVGLVPTVVILNFGSAGGEIVKEIIKSIEETSFRLDRFPEYDGYIIKTNTQSIHVGIDNSQCCCEEWGYVSTNDISNEVVGAELLEIKITDDALNTENFTGKWSGATMFVTFETNRGTFQLVMYNDHNGFYGHQTIVHSKQIIHSEIL